MKKPATLGDAPVQEQYRAQMIRLAEFLDNEFNYGAKGGDRSVGFVLLMFPFGEKEGRCNYISNGAGRKDIVTLFREQIRRFEGAPDQEGHA
jgi:hypothetical protein